MKLWHKPTKYPLQISLQPFTINSYLGVLNYEDDPDMGYNYIVLGKFHKGPAIFHDEYSVI